MGCDVNLGDMIQNVCDKDDLIRFEGEDTLFAMGKDLQLLKSSQFMFPKLSHT